MVVEYRTFRNSDPPAILAVWQASRGPRAMADVASCDTLESLLFSKPYFDREGLILAQVEGQIVGFAHAGFGADDAKSALEYSLGAVYMLLVRPEFRRQGIGGSLLRLAQAYLIDHGARMQYFGGMFPLNAFYLGLYGGSELPGLLESDTELRRFAQNRGYEAIDECHVYQRSLDELPRVSDTRIHLLRRTVEVQAEPWPLPDTWWDACVLGNIPTLRYEMLERDSHTRVGRALVWEMECFGRAWGGSTVGIVDFEIELAYRRRGYGKLLLLTMLKHLREQQIDRVEIQTMDRNSAARGLYESLGFERIDVGHAHRLRAAPDLSQLPTLRKRPPVVSSSRWRGRPKV